MEGGADRRHYPDEDQHVHVARLSWRTCTVASTAGGLLGAPTVGPVDRGGTRDFSGSVAEGGTFGTGHLANPSPAPVVPFGLLFLLRPLRHSPCRRRSAAMSAVSSNSAMANDLATGKEIGGGVAGILTRMELPRITSLVGALVMIAGGATVLAYGLYVFEGRRPRASAWAVLAILGGLAWLWFLGHRKRRHHKWVAIRFTPA